MNVEFGMACATARGETICGDSHVIVERADDWLVCVVDGLGHGPAAAEAARLATGHVGEHPDADLQKTLRDLDALLRPTRGAAVSLVFGTRSTGHIRFAGIGNVELRARTRDRFSPITVPGIVGRGFRKVLVLEHQLAPNDLLLLSTDGLSSRVDLGLAGTTRAAELAELLLRTFHRGPDDALCVTMRAMDPAP